MSYSTSESTTGDWMWSVLALTVQPFVEAVVNYETEQLFNSPLKYFESRGGTLGYGVNLALRGGASTLLGGLYTLGFVTDSLLSGELPDLTELGEDLGDLVDVTSRITIGGVLPNAPGFDQALLDKTDELEKTYKQAMKKANATQTTAMGRLDVALGLGIGGNAPIGQGGQNKQMTSEEFHAALMLGAHFVKPGPGLYQALQVDIGGPTGQTGMRSSSHYKNQPAPQYGLDLPDGLGHLLVGLTETGDTFFQLESHGVGNPNMDLVTKALEGANHMLAYGQHITGAMNYVQVGPGGCIAGSEKDGQHVTLN